MLISYIGMVIGYINKGFLFLLILSTEQIGLISIILAAGMLLAQFSNLGSIYTIWRFFPFFRDKEKKHHGFLPLMLLIILSGVLIVSILAVFFRPEIESLYLEKSAMFVNYYWWIFPIGISYVIYMALEVYLRAMYKNIISVFSMDILLRLVITGLLILLFMEKIDFHFFVIAHSLVYLIPPIVLLVYLAWIGELNLSFSSIKISRRFRKILIRFSMFNYVNTLGVVLVSTLDVLMIAQLIGLEETGVYGTIIFLTSALQVPYRSIVRVASPLVSDHWKHRRIEEMTRLYKQVSSVSLFIALGSFLIIWMNIDFIFSFIREESWLAFQPGIWVFFFLMIGRIIDMYFGLNGSIFTTSKKYKYDIYFTIFLIGAVYGLNLLFIPWWGMAGAAISTSVALVVYNFGRLIFVWATFKIHPFEKNQFVLIGIALITFTIGELCGNLSANKWIQACIDTGIFGIVFLFPIYRFNLEPNSVDYVNKGMAFVKKKILG